MSFANVNKEILQKRLGNNIRLLRTSKNISQQELATLCDFEKSNMSRIEAGKTNVTFINIVKIAKALSIDLKELVDFSID